MTSMQANVTTSPRTSLGAGGGMANIAAPLVNMVNGSNDVDTMEASAAGTTESSFSDWGQK